MNPQYASAGNLAHDFEALFATLVPTQICNQSLLDFSHVQLHKHFGKVNLNYVSLHFLLNNSHVWTPLPIHFAVHAKSESMQEPYAALLKSSGFETASNLSLGVMSANPADHATA